MDKGLFSRLMALRDDMLAGGQEGHAATVADVILALSQHGKRKRCRGCGKVAGHNWATCPPRTREPAGASR